MSVCAVIKFAAVSYPVFPAPRADLDGTVVCDEQVLHVVVPNPHLSQILQQMVVHDLQKLGMKVKDIVRCAAPPANSSVCESCPLISPW